MTVNAPNAIVYVDNVPAPGGTTKVSGGAHNVKVHADGFFDFNGPVEVRGDTTFPVNLSPQGFPLTIRVGVTGARIFVDGAEVTGTVPLVSTGPHSILVQARGFADYAATVNVLAPMSFDVALQPALSLLVNVDVPNASISVDNVPIQGNVAFVSRGPHNLNVHADGFADWNGMVNVLGNMSFQVRLVPAGLPLTVRVNVPGAAISIDGVDTQGTIPLVARGPHTVRVSAPGYQDYNSVIAVNGPLTITVQLMAANSVLAFVIPPIFRDPDIQPGDTRGQVRIFVDGRLVNPNSETERIPIAPGRHTVRIASGAFSMQLGELEVQPGQSYIVELSMDMKVRAVRSSRQ